MDCQPSTSSDGKSTSVTNDVTTSTSAIASASTHDADKSSCNVWCSCCGALRYVLVLLGLIGNAIDFMLRFNLSVAIVAMVNTSDTETHSSSYACPAAINASSDAQNTAGGGEYNWSAGYQGLILGAFFWGFVITRTVGGRISEIFGPTLIVSLTVGFSSVFSLLTPTAADTHPLLLAALRFLLGLLEGPIYPAMYIVISRWAPAGETAMMLSSTSTGMPLGALVSLGLSGLVIKTVGWRWVFWGTGLLGLAWLPFWIIFVRDDPRRHPGISSHELRLLGKNQSRPRRKVPWGQIFKSRHIYLLIMMEFVNVCIQTTLLYEGPTFLVTQIGMNLKMLGLVNIVILATVLFFFIFYAWLSDLVERRSWMSMITFRRLIQMFGTVVQLGGLILLGVAGCNGMMVVGGILIVAVGIPVNVVTYLLAPVVLAPNYAGTISGIMGVGDISGLLFPLFVSAFMYKKNGWAIVFLVNAVMTLLSGVIFTIGMPRHEEKWNQYEEIPGSNETDAKTGVNGSQNAGHTDVK